MAIIISFWHRVSIFASRECGMENGMGFFFQPEEFDMLSVVGRDMQYQSRG